MGLYKGPPEGGSGGKRGHSNMEHFVCHDEIKAWMRKRRRLKAKRAISEQVGEVQRSATQEQQEQKNFP